MHKFRQWDDFYYKFDTSHCDDKPEFYKSIVRIYETATDKEIWKIEIGLKDGAF